MATSNQSESKAADTADGPFRFRESFEATAANRAALEEDDLVQIHADVISAMHIVLAAVPRVAALREEIAKLPVDQTLIDQLETFACAAGHAHSLYAVSSAPPEQLEEVYQDALKRRTALKSDVQNLVQHELIPADSLSGVCNETGFRNVAADLMCLVNIMRTAGSRIEGRTATLPDDLDRAEMVANELVEMIAKRDGTSAMPSAIAADRVRAYSLMARAYDETRRAVQFVCWRNGEADKVTPSMFIAKARRKTEASELPKAESPEPAPQPASVASPVIASAPANPGVRGGNPFTGA